MINEEELIAGPAACDKWRKITLGLDTTIPQGKTGHSLSIHYQNLCVAMFVPEGLAKFGTHHQKGWIENEVFGAWHLFATRPHHRLSMKWKALGMLKPPEQEKNWWICCWLWNSEGQPIKKKMNMGGGESFLKTSRPAEINLKMKWWNKFENEMLK